MHGDAIIFDLSGVGAQVAGYNSGPTAGRSACEVALKCLTTPLVLPINEAAFRLLTIVLLPGRVVSATKPAALQWWMTEWSAVAAWDPEARYKPIGSATRQAAELMIASARVLLRAL